MWGYYGSKSKIVNKYPEPEFGKIIEPFAGKSGIDLRIIQKIAGHSSSKTTEIYTHVSKQLLSKVALPM
jgi:hypothetical protein